MSLCSSLHVELMSQISHLEPGVVLQQLSDHLRVAALVGEVELERQVQLRLLHQPHELERGEEELHRLFGRKTLN